VSRFTAALIVFGDHRPDGIQSALVSDPFVGILVRPAANSLCRPEN